MAAVSEQTKQNTIFSLAKLRKEYRMGEVTVHALREVTLDIYEGEFLVILGPSGSGKSTLLNILGGLDPPTEGEVIFRGSNVANYSERELTGFRRDHIGFVFQFYNLIPNLTALENVEMATEISKDPLEPSYVLDVVDLEPRSSHFPSQLSGGEQQRVAIARALAKKPDVLLCDEPTGALDISTGKLVLQALANINTKTNTTVVVVTHNSVIGAMANRVITMKDGRVHNITVNKTQHTADELEW